MVYILLRHLDVGGTIGVHDVDGGMRGPKCMRGIYDHAALCSVTCTPVRIHIERVPGSQAYRGIAALFAAPRQVNAVNVRDMIAILRLASGTGTACTAYPQHAVPVRWH